MNILTLDKNEFQKGITLDNEDEAGGISPISYGLNYFLSKGFTLIPQPSYIATSADPTEHIVDGCIDPSFLGDEAFLIDNDGKFYLLSSTTLTLKQTDSVKEYSYGTTRILTFKGEIFCTSKNDITKLAIDLSTIDATWWTTTLGKTALNQYYRHPIEIVEDTMYIADNNMIHTWDGTTGIYNAMTLPPEFNITELRIDNDGRYLLAFASGTVNYSHNKKSKAKIFIIDTVTLEFVREVVVADQTESAINVGGTIYVIYGKSFGYFTGTGYKLLRTLDITSPIYSARLTKIDNTIVMAEKDKILAYGNVSGKGNIFFYPGRSETPYNTINSLLAIGHTGMDDNKLLINYEDGSINNKVKILDFDSRGGYGISVLTKKYRKGKVWIRRIEVETETLESGDTLGVSIVNADGTYTAIGSITYSTHGAIQNARIDCNQLVEFIQLRLIWFRFAIKKLTIYYESGE